MEDSQLTQSEEDELGIVSPNQDNLFQTVDERDCFAEYKQRETSCFQERPALPEPKKSSSRRLVKRSSGSSFKREYQRLAQDILSGKRKDPLAKLLDGMGIRSVKPVPRVAEVQKRFDGYVSKAAARRANLQNELQHAQDEPPKPSSRKSARKPSKGDFKEFLRKQRDFSAKKDSHLASLREDALQRSLAQEKSLREESLKARNKQSAKLLHSRRASGGKSVFDRLYDGESPPLRNASTDGSDSRKEKIIRSLLKPIPVRKSNRCEQLYERSKHKKEERNQKVPHVPPIAPSVKSNRMVLNKFTRNFESATDSRPPFLRTPEIGEVLVAMGFLDSQTPKSALDQTLKDIMLYIKGGEATTSPSPLKGLSRRDFATENSQNQSPGKQEEEEIVQRESPDAGTGEQSAWLTEGVTRQDLRKFCMGVLQLDEDARAHTQFRQLYYAYRQGRSSARDSASNFTFTPDIRNKSSRGSSKQRVEELLEKGRKTQARLEAQRKAKQEDEMKECVFKPQTNIGKKRGSSTQRTPLLFADVITQLNQKTRITIYEGDDVDQVTREFARTHGLTEVKEQQLRRAIEGLLQAE